MIGNVTLGTSDLGRATAFYDFLFGVVGVPRQQEQPGRWVAWGTTPDAPVFAVAVPPEGGRASANDGDGAGVALHLRSPAEVAALHALAVALGGKDEGAPGPRGEGKYFEAAFRDRDGNRLTAFCEIDAHAA